MCGPARRPERDPVVTSDLWRVTVMICKDTLLLNPRSGGGPMADESMDEVMDWIVSGVRPDEQPTSEAPRPEPPEGHDGPVAICGLAVGTAFEVVRDHEALRGRWRVVKIDRGPRGTLRAWARNSASTDYLPLTEPQIRDALEHGWLLILEGDRRAGEDRRRGGGAEYTGPERRRGERRRSHPTPEPG